MSCLCHPAQICLTTGQLWQVSAAWSTLAGLTGGLVGLSSSSILAGRSTPLGFPINHTTEPESQSLQTQPPWTREQSDATKPNFIEPKLWLHFLGFARVVNPILYQSLFPIPLSEKPHLSTTCRYLTGFPKEVQLSVSLSS